MPDYGQELQFGIFPTPNAADAAGLLELAALADVSGLDLVTVQDHPYQARFLDTWTLLSVMAARTSSVRLAPNVANLPLRPPVVLARSAASLDILSGGRVELGLGAGAFWDAIVAVGGRRLSAGESVDALVEAIAVIRAVWDTGQRSIRLEGRHYRVVGAHPGPAPAHAIEIWVGAYGRRMLGVTGRLADGWLPSQGYLPPDRLADANRRIDEAALAAGRDPVSIRRLYNINGQFGTGSGFLAGRARDWAEQLAAMTLRTGMSTYILATDDPETVERFAAEVAPAVREFVDAERQLATTLPAQDQRAHTVTSQQSAGGVAGEPGAVTVFGGSEHDESREHGGTDSAGGRGGGGGRSGSTDGSSGRGGTFAVQPTPDDGTRRSDERLWDETIRPIGPAPQPDRRYTADEQAAGRHLVDVHDALRAELEQLHDVIGQVQRGVLDAGRARSIINEMAVRQNNWTLGAFCQSYCRVVAGHHSLEDRSVFPHLRRSDDRLAPVLDRLADEHEVIAEVLDRVDRALVEMITDPDGMAALKGAVDLLDDTLRSHLSYEERELVEPLARLGFY